MLFEGTRNTVVPPRVAARARRKLMQLHAAVEVDYLRMPPGNRLEKLSGDRDGQWSVRINAQYRLCSGPEADCRMDGQDVFGASGVAENGSEGRMYARWIRV